MFGNTPLPEVFRRVAAAGYDGVEIAPFTIGASVSEIPPRRRAEIRRTAQTCGIALVGTHWLLKTPDGLSITAPDPAVRRKTADTLVALADFTADLGGTIMVLGSPAQRRLAPGQTAAEGLRYLEEVLAPALERANALGVYLCLEPLAPAETNFITTAREAIAAIWAINHPNLRLVLDTKAMLTEQTSIPDIIRSSAPFLQHFHANDANLLGPGMGPTDFQPIMAALNEIGYDGYVSVEVFDFTPGPERIAGESIAYLRKSLSAVCTRRLLS